jgi:glucosamine 6-phosphate synthetase-like amidotransferase/phosphosugar isomerase protein
MSFGEALKYTTEKCLKGQWGLVILDRDSQGKIFLSKKGSPILVGFDKESFYVSSERIAFEKYSEKLLSL